MMERRSRAWVYPDTRTMVDQWVRSPSPRTMGGTRTRWHATRDGRTLCGAGLHEWAVWSHLPESNETVCARCQRGVRPMERSDGPTVFSDLGLEVEWTIKP